MTLMALRVFTQTQLFKMRHKPCCEQFHKGTILFPPNYTVSLHRGKHIHSWAERVTLVKSWDVNINVVPPWLSCNVSCLRSLASRYVLSY